MYNKEKYIAEINTIIEKVNSIYECKYNKIELARICGCANEFLDYKERADVGKYEMKYYRCVCRSIIDKCNVLNKIEIIKIL